MSGGSHDYLYAKIANEYINPKTPERKEFVRLLEKVSKALHRIEWNDSGDSDDYVDESALIRDCLKEWSGLRVKHLTCKFTVQASSTMFTSALTLAETLKKSLLPNEGLACFSVETAEDDPAMEVHKGVVVAWPSNLSSS